MINFDSYNIKLDCAFPISWKKGTAYARGRKFDALSFRINGSALYRHGEKEFAVNKNDVLFIPASYDYSITANRSEDVLVVHFYLNGRERIEPEVFTPINPDAFERLFTEISNVWRTKATGYKYKAYSIFYRILCEMERQREQKELLVNPKKLQLAIDYIHESFNNPQTTIESIARHIGTSSVYLRKLFRTSLEKSPLQYLNDIRIEHAVSLLKTGYYSIQDVATLSGFNDAKYFSTIYKKRTGHPPSKDFG